MTNFLKELEKFRDDEIVDVEVVSVCHMLRLFMKSGACIQVVGSWRVRSGKSIVVGALDMDFHTESDEALMDEEDSTFTKKLSVVKGKNIKVIEKLSDFGDINVVFTGGKELEVFCLSKPGPLMIFR